MACAWICEQTFGYTLGEHTFDCQAGGVCVNRKNLKRVSENRFQIKRDSSAYIERVFALYI